jgi:hypothetical protein
MLPNEYITAYIAQAMGLLNTVLSAAQLKTDEPPRLAEAINLSKCDPPPEVGGITNTFDATTGALLASTAQLDSRRMPSAEALVAIIQWIDQRARASTWDEIWEASSPEHTTWPQDNAAEEQWARHYEQLFLGAPFLGLTTVYGLTPSGEGSSAGEGFAAYVYGRIQRRSRWVFERPVSDAHRSSTVLTNWGSCNIESWNDLGPTPESNLGDWHLASYVRGSVGPLDRNGFLVPDPSGPRWIEFPNEDPAVPIAVGCQHLCSYGALTRGFRIEHIGYHGHMAGLSNAELPLYRSPSGDPWNDDYGQHDVPILEDEERALGQWGRWTDASRVGGIVEAGSAYVLGPEQPGDPVSSGHCLCITRVKPGASSVDSRLQEIDTHCMTPEKTPCVFDGNGLNVRSSTASAFGAMHNRPLMGIGTAPFIDPVHMIEHLGKARPVGLMRLLISRRDPGILPGGRGTVLYISPMNRMYGDDDRQNYAISRMLWAVRNSPGFTNLKPALVFFAPVANLARSMWAYASRTVRLGDFDATVEKITAKSYTPVAGISNRSQATGARAGTSWCSIQVSEVALLAARAISVPWNESFVHPQLEAHRTTFENAGELFRVDAARLTSDPQPALDAAVEWMERLAEATGLTAPATAPGGAPPTGDAAVDEVIDTLAEIYEEFLHG